MKLALIHTGSAHAPVFTQLCAEIMPEVEVFNIVDESLILNTIAADALTASTSKRVAGCIQSAEEAGADAILVTCSSIGPAVEAARPFVAIPVLRVDQPMADEAVRAGQRIGVIATLSTTLGPTVDLVKTRAAAQGKEVEIVEHLCAGAFDRLQAGDRDGHDRMVAAGIEALIAKTDVVLLAQASMAGALDTLPAAAKTVPVLTSPRSGVEGARKAIDELS